METKTEKPGLGDRRYWLDEVMRLREAWGLKTFWADPEKAGRALKALLYVWGNTTNATEGDTSMMQATCWEFDKRLAYSLKLV